MEYCGEMIELIHHGLLKIVVIIGCGLAEEIPIVITQ